jgi:hypothetical protein
MFTSIIFPMTDYISQPSWQKEYLGQWNVISMLFIFKLCP